MSQITVVFSVVLLAAAPVAAQDSGFSRPGPYLGVGGSVGFYTELEDDLEETAAALGYILSADVDHPLGVNLRAGYRVEPWLAAEVEWEYLSDADIELEGIAFAEVRTWAFTGNLKIFPIQTRLQPFVLVGVGALRQRMKDSLGFGYDESETVAAGRFGGGLDFYLTDSVVLSLDATYLLPAGDLNGADGDYVSIGWGAQYRF